MKLQAEKLRETLEMVFMTRVCHGGLPVGSSGVEQNRDRLKSQKDLGSNPSGAAYGRCDLEQII